MTNDILKKLLSARRNRLHIAGAAVGAFIGLTLLIFALQTWFDLQKLLRGGKTVQFETIVFRFE